MICYFISVFLERPTISKFDKEKVRFEDFPMIVICPNEPHFKLGKLSKIIGHPIDKMNVSNWNENFKPPEQEIDDIRVEFSAKINDSERLKNTFSSLVVRAEDMVESVQIVRVNREPETYSVEQVAGIDTFPYNPTIGLFCPSIVIPKEIYFKGKY